MQLQKESTCKEVKRGRELKRFSFSKDTTSDQNLTANLQKEK